MQYFPSLLLALGCTALAAALPSYHKTQFSWNNTQSLITFGDSYTYIQGLLGYVNSTFIGDLQNLAFTKEQLLSNRIVQNQTATAEGGPNWVEYLTGCGLTPGLTAPRDCKIQLWDFAFGGSDISVDFTPLHHNYTVSFVNQIKQFLTYGQPVLSEFLNPQQSLIGIWIGINDIGDSSKYNITGINGTANLTHPFASFPSFYNLILDTEFASVQQLYSTGYRNFIFFTLPPLDKTPGNILAGSKALPNATMVGWYNDAIASHTKVFQERNRDAKVMLFDAHEVLEGVLEDPGKYGIKNTTGYCVGYNQPDIQTDPGKYGCAPLEEYFWYNTGHLTSHVHSILAGELRDFLLRQ